MNKTEKIEYIAGFYGEEHRTRQLVEECGELIQAVSKMWRGKEGALNHMAEEMADVEICLEQIKYLYDLDGAVNEWKERKIDREIDRIRGEIE